MLLCCSILAIPVSAQNITETQAFEVTELPAIYISSEAASIESETISSNSIENSRSGVAGSCLYALTAADVGSSGYSEISSQLSLLYNAGYSYQLFNHDKYAKQICNEIPLYDIVILHGHAYAGELYVDIEASGAYRTYLYSVTSTLPTINDASLSNLTTGSISAKLMIFSACNSGATNSTYTTSLATMGYLKGAETTLGYRGIVSNTEWYSHYLIEGLVMGKTFANALLYADELYQENLTFVTSATSPAVEANRLVHGTTTLTI